MNPNLDRLQPYPFEKLAALTRDIEPPPDLAPIALSIGEPKHATPSIIREALTAHLHHLATYPTTRGMPELREAIAAWLTWRFRLPPGAIDPARHLLPVNGTREALFAFAQASIERGADALVLMPNPFYQIYEGAALLAGATPWYLPCTTETGFVPDFDAVPERVWDRCRLLYLCSPGNPTGAVLDEPTLAGLIERAQRHDFILAADECYSEIYLDEDHPPPGLLQVAAAQGLDDFRNCIVFHSLSKRSNAPGLRSGFVAGDAALIEPYFRYRTYHGCAMPLQHQHASRVAWQDETHVIDNRAQYRAKFDAVLPILSQVLDVQRPVAGFYLWPRTGMPDTDFARGLLAEQHVRVLPGSYLSRPGDDGRDPGAGHARLALVAPIDECVEAAQRIRAFIGGH
jgi:N-succinyldiaminopimelate aminotransferase